VWSSVEGPIKVAGCAAPPENKIMWTGTGAEFYYLYRTETPTKPIGWRNCGIASGLPADREMSWTDKGILAGSRLVDPTGNASQKPEGKGRYLVGISKGEAIVDKGQELQTITAYDMNTSDASSSPRHTRLVPMWWLRRICRSALASPKQ
jgi:hypothetical protein